METSLPPGFGKENPPMIDHHGRNINKLRISLSEVCNMACTYCVTSLSDHKRAPDELSMDQMLSLIRILKDHAGIEKVRLTGGEPLLYHDLIKVLSGIRDLGITSIGMTSNGQLLARKAKALSEAGLKNVNLSLDSLDPEKFKRLGRVGKLHKTLEGIEECLKYGLRVKVILDYDHVDFNPESIFQTLFNSLQCFMKFTNSSQTFKFFWVKGVKT
jgi:cyclic pyranopterin phosphate synthase